MAFVTGEVVPNPDAPQPFKVVFKQDEEVLSEWPVDSVEQGEQDILEALRGMNGA